MNKTKSYKIIDELVVNPSFNEGDIKSILEDLRNENYTGPLSEYLFAAARFVREPHYGHKVFLRGLIEFTNYCKNDCYYCGIRRSNNKATRYRLSLENILLCCKIGYNNGLRTFVLQGGEDMYFATSRVVDIVSAIKKNYPDCAITLSIGEKNLADYKAYFKAGADRFLLRHETADYSHYAKLHPAKMSFAHRMQCLQELKDIGFQVGAGMMIGSPYQTMDNLITDLKFLSSFKPHMIGIGPFIPHNQTPFKDRLAGSVPLTLVILSLVRLLLPKVLLPATTALATLSENGTIKGLEAGANVIMPNISPIDIRNLYTLYNNKKITGGESLEGINKLKDMLNAHGYQAVATRGDSLM